jgi:predicted lysophospholipase L1 biosynthesis ABC-type transport system permease subunit
MDMAEKHGIGGKRERVSLDSAATHILEECRMVLPGIQALFGFQLIAVFNQGFAEKLSPGQQLIHLAAIALVTVAVALVMTPAALHRQTEPQEVSERFIWLATRLLLASMFPLAFGLCADVYLVAVIITRSEAAAVAIALALLAVLGVLWVFLPRRERRMPT